MGIGFKVNIFKGLSINQKIGGGVMLIIAYGDRDPNKAQIGKPNIDWQFCGLFSTGLSYHFHSNKKE